MGWKDGAGRKVGVGSGDGIGKGWKGLLLIVWISGGALIWVCLRHCAKFSVLYALRPVIIVAYSQDGGFGFGVCGRGLTRTRVRCVTCLALHVMVGIGLVLLLGLIAMQSLLSFLWFAPLSNFFFWPCISALSFFCKREDEG